MDTYKYFGIILLLGWNVASSGNNPNLYDTYNADECKRVRRPWNGLTSSEKHLYVDGLLEVRKKGNLDIATDEFVNIAAMHNYYASITHHDSAYLFYHGYIVWELESRIRNLGGRYKCFGMPYWDITREYSDDGPFLLVNGGILGGWGDPSNSWRVNGYSWDVTINEYWIPRGWKSDTHCIAEGDNFPICSLKRLKDDDFSSIAASDIGDGIVKHNSFIEFEKWLTTSLILDPSIDQSYDPIWYLYHSMQGYYQAMWVNYNKYYLINSDDLDDYKEVYHPYCEVKEESDITNIDQCTGIRLDDPFYIPESQSLLQKDWSYIHDNDLTVRKLYKLPQWNIIYDLSDDAFFHESGLDIYTKGKLSKEWFILPKNYNEDDYYYKEEQEEEILSKNINGSYSSFKQQTDIFYVFIIFSIIGCISYVTYWLLKSKQQKKEIAARDRYGTFADEK